MPLYDDILEVWREFTVFNGANPLPIGDPSSGQWNPTKAQIRDVLIAMLQASGDANALATLISEMRARKVVGTEKGTFSGTTFPTGAETVIFRNASTTQIWRLLSAAPAPVVSGRHQQDAQNRWWERTFNSGDLTPATIAITAASSASDRNANSWTAPNVFRSVTAAIISPGSPAAAATPANALVDVVQNATGVRMVWRDQSGETYERTYNATTLVWSDWTTLRSIRKTYNISAQSASFRNLDGHLSTETAYTMDGTNVLNSGPFGNSAYVGSMHVRFAGNGLEQVLFQTGEPTPWVRRISSTGVFAAWRRQAIGGTGKRTVVIGDSIVAGVGATDLTRLGWAGLLSEAYGGDILRWGVTGAQMSPTTALQSNQQDGSFTRRVASGAADLATASEVIVAYGTNDFNRATPIGTLADTTESTFYGAMRLGYNAIMAASPSCRVMFMLPIYRAISSSNPAEDLTLNSAGHSLNDYRNAITNFCAAVRIEAIDVYRRTGVTAANAAQLVPDAIHPSNSLHRRIFQIAISALLGMGDIRSEDARTAQNAAAIEAQGVRIGALEISVPAGFAARPVSQRMGRGDAAAAVLMEGVPVLAFDRQGRARFVADDWVLADLAARLDLSGGGGGGGLSVSPDVLGPIDGWNVRQDEDLLTFTADLPAGNREYIMRVGESAWLNGRSEVPVRLLYGDEMGGAGVSATSLQNPYNVATLNDGAGQAGLGGFPASGPATGIQRAGMGFASLVGDFWVEAQTVARWVVARAENVAGASLSELSSGQRLTNLVRALTEAERVLPDYRRTAVAESVTIMHGAGNDSPTYGADLLALMLAINEQVGPRRINLYQPSGTTERADFNSAEGTLQAFRDKPFSLPVTLVSPTYWCGISAGTIGVLDAVSMTMLAELEARAALDVNWIPPLAYYAERSGDVINIDFEVMPGASLVAPTTGLFVNGATIASRSIVADPVTGRLTRLRIVLSAVPTATVLVRYCRGPAARFSGDMRDNWSAPSITGGTLYRRACSFQFEV